MNQHCIIQRWFGISDVSDNADTESALYDKCWFGISAVSDNADISFQRYVLPNNFSFKAMRAVGYSADLDLALYPTTLIQN